jgi:hypothetical protein
MESMKNEVAECMENVEAEDLVVVVNLVVEYLV